MSYRVVVTPQAEEQVLEAGLWWLANRPKAPDLFADELAWALGYLEHAPLTGVALRGRHRNTRRLLLHKTRYALYYTVSESSREVEVVALWHTSKGAGPPL